MLTLDMHGSGTTAIVLIALAAPYVQAGPLMLVERPILAAFLVLAVIAMATPMVLERLRFRGQMIELEQDNS